MALTNSRAGAALYVRARRAGEVAVLSSNSSEATRRVSHNHTQPLRPIIAKTDALLSALTALAARAARRACSNSFGLAWAHARLSAVASTRLCTLQDGSDAPNQRSEPFLRILLFRAGF